MVNAFFLNVELRIMFMKPIDINDSKKNLINKNAGGCFYLFV